MTNVLLTRSLTLATVVSFIQNRLKEFGIGDDDIKNNLDSLSEGVTTVVKTHFEYSHLITTEEDLYYDEIYYVCIEFLKEIKLTALKGSKLRKLHFIIIKVLDQIIIEAKEQQLTSLANITIEVEKGILDFK